MSYNLKIEKTNTPKTKPANQNELGFGNYFTDHMFVVDYETGKGWHDARIVPYQNLSLDPAAMVFHYAQETFEGLKAYMGEDGQVRLFRPEENFSRMTMSNERVCIPAIDEGLALYALKELINLDRDWVPTLPDTSLYIRPFVIATDPHVGVRAADHYMFIIILSPVGAYYKEGLKPVAIYVENNYVRSVKGGTGMAKTGGNYAASLKAQNDAKGKHFTQVLWLDGVERRYIEEVGTMNVFFKIDGEVITPSLEGSILPGITRKSVIELLRAWGIKLSERRLSIEEVTDAYKAGKLEEAFGTGTAAVISPIGNLTYGELSMDLSGGQIGELSAKLYKALTDIQWGKAPDTFGWTQTV